jgi:3-oxoacyl-[acyl-carrier protein] reductase
MTKKVAGKVALVTGYSRGIGAASARALADEGANVAVSYVASADKAVAVVKELTAKGVEARAFKADQASPSGALRQACPQAFVSAGPLRPARARISKRNIP